MSEAHIIKAIELRALARQFRARSDETQFMKYVELMRRSAFELESLAEQIEAGASPVEAFSRTG